MAQPQQQPYPMPQAQRPFSPQQASPSPGAQQQFSHQNKRPRLSPPQGQAPSPYVQSPYGMSPNASGPHSASASPHFANVQLPQVQQAYTTPYTTNGNHTPTSTPGPSQSQPNHYNTQHASPLGFPGQAQANHQPNYANNYMINMPQAVGAMGPPSKPAEKPKEDGIDPMDVLGGTGINLQEEEQFTFQIHNGSFNSQQSGSQSGTISSGHSFSQFPPADEASFYGAGPANAEAEAARTKSQDEYHRKMAERAWNDAARDLAISRQRELNNPFLIVGNVHKKMEKVARDHGLTLNTESNKGMGTMKLPEAFPSPTVNIKTSVGPDGAISASKGTFVPLDSLLVDQLALMSIATKHRLRGLLEDAARLAKGRQTGSHGVIPEKWIDAVAPSQTESGSLVVDGAPRSGWESAISPHSNPLKHSFSSANRIPTPVSEGTKTPTESVKLHNEVVNALRKAAQKERQFEEERLKKRMARNSEEATSRQGSVMPGTPGSVAPESTEKAPTKKELKKKADAKTNEAASHAAANQTTNQFLGGGSGLFGKKKKYSWMSAGGSASGTSTPGRIMTQGLPGTPGAAVISMAPEKLTADGARRLGMWREDKDKGRGIQIRDWVTVLESDGREKKALQMAYANLDSSEPK